MWLPRELRCEQRTYSFEHAGRAAHSDLALVADDRTIANMLRAVDWEEDPVQVEVCEHCGTARCSSGGFVAVQRLGHFVALVPSLKAYGPNPEHFTALSSVPRRSSMRGEPCSSGTPIGRDSRSTLPCRRSGT